MSPWVRASLVAALALAPTAAIPQAGHDDHAVPPAPVEAPAAVREEPRTAISVPVEQQRRIGLKTEHVVRQPMRHVVRTVGIVAIDERLEAHVHTRFAGWIEDIRVDYVGRAVSKGETLCSFYSPELVALQDEYLASRGRGGLGAEIAGAALDRLRLFGVPKSEIGRLERGEKARLRIPIESPIDGFVIEKTAIQGMYVTPEMQLYRIADLSQVWVLAELYEYDLPIVAPGDEAVVTITYEPDRRFRGRITYVYPEVTGETRTGKARLEVENSEGKLRPGQYANVELEKDLGQVLSVADSAVIDTGVRRIAFVRTDAERFEPREVKLGPRADGRVAVLDGLAESEEVVTRANFLIDAESRLRAAIEKGIRGPSGHSGH